MVAFVFFIVLYIEVRTNYLCCGTYSARVGVSLSESTEPLDLNLCSNREENKCKKKDRREDQQPNDNFVNSDF